MRQGEKAFLSTGIKLWRPWSCALLLEGYERAGEREDGLRLLSEALAFVEETGERSYEAELYRLKGELTLQSQASLGQVEAKSHARQSKSRVEQEAEACFWRALEIARKQQAKSLELRATMSLTRLWQQQGKRNEAHQMLSKIYNWFAEGFDTKDLQEAKTLLDGLA